MKNCKTLLSLFAVVAFWTGTASAQLGFNGPHYNLNLKASTTCPGDDIKGTNTHVIHVLLNSSDPTPTNPTPIAQLSKTNKIFLTKDDPTDGDDFQVLDGNACDGDGAGFMLPVNDFVCPADGTDCDDSDFTTYQVFAVELGGPNHQSGNSYLTTCGIEDNDTVSTADDTFICSTENVVLLRERGKPTWDNVTKELTSLCLDTDASGTCDTRIGIFDDLLEGYYWDYDNNGVRLVQLRFYLLPD